MRLARPTRAAGRERPRDYLGLRRDITAAPIRSCSRWGLPCRPCCQGRGALLPHRFALARGTGLLARGGLARAVCFLWHFPWGRPRRRLAGTAFPWSPDFPPRAELLRARRPSGCLARGDVRFRGVVVKRSEVLAVAGRWGDLSAMLCNRLGACCLKSRGPKGGAGIGFDGREIHHGATEITEEDETSGSDVRWSSAAR